jgi:DNA (cytosine-5)-methyltransferase 1
VDIARTTTHISLCSGYAGIDLGLKRAVPSLLTIAYSEIEAFACANLVAKMEKGFLDPAPIWTDLKTFPWQSFSGKVDILSGGYPCQPFSTAGGRKGSEDPRHLWPYIANGIRLSKPGICFFENVEGHISLGLSTVISDLEEMGYKVSWGIFSASEVGAPHQRKRTFILANNNSGRQLQSKRFDQSKWRWPLHCGKEQYEWEPSRVMGDTNRGRQSSKFDSRSSTEENGGGEDDTEQTSRAVYESQGKRQQESREIKGCSFESSSRRKAESKMGGDSNGSANWMGHAKLYQSCDNRCDELRLLGNGVVPQVAEKAFLTLMLEQ